MTVKKLRQALSVVLIIVVLAGAGALYLNHLMQSPAERMLQGSTVIQSLEKVAKLATVVYKTEKVYGIDDSKRIYDIEIPGMQKKYLLMVKATVTAGIDLGQLTPNDIRVAGREVSIRLPRPVVLSRELNDVTNYDQQLGFFRRLFDPYNVPDELKRVSGELLDSIVTDVQKDGLLEEARSGAEVAIAQYLQGLGYEKVSFLEPEVALTP
ncbi:MAG: DUF4230 domain-containing protein [Bacillota bacterium]